MTTSGDNKLPEHNLCPCGWASELGICVGWDESRSKPINTDRIICRPKMVETPLPRVHDIITHMHSLLERERTASVVRRPLTPWQTAPCRSFPFLKKNKEGAEGEGTAKAKLSHKTFYYNKPINIWLCYTTRTMLKAAKCLPEKAMQNNTVRQRALAEAGRAPIQPPVLSCSC